MGSVINSAIGLGIDKLASADNHYINTGLAPAPTGYGMYDQLFASNPYRNLQYKKSWWQDVVSAFGFRTDADRWLEDAQVNANEYDASIFSMMQQNQYNSPVEQAQRMRAAGLNPDLLGVGDVSDAASPTQDVNGMSPNDTDAHTLSIVSSIGSTLMNIIPQTMSFMTSLVNLRGIRMDNDLKELTFNSDITKFVEDFFKQGITQQDYQDAFSSQNFENLLIASEKNSDDLASRLFSSKRAQRNFKMNYGRYARSLVARMSKYKSYEDFEEARESITKTRASQFFSDDDDTQITLIQSILKPFEEFQKLVYENSLTKELKRDPELEQETINAGLETEKAYQQALNGADIAEAENAQNDYAKQLYGILKDADEMFSKIMKALDDADKWYSPVAKALVGIARSQLLSGIHLQLGQHSASYTNPSTGAESQSAGWNFGF